MAVTTSLPHFPDLVMHQIILRLPTKPAIRMSSLSKQWEGVWSALHALDFDEGDLLHGNDDNDHHTKFINILVRYLEFRKKDKQQPVLDKFRLRMMSYMFGEDDSVIAKLLSNSFQRNVKALDVSLRSKHKEVNWYYCLSPGALVNAKSITALNLEYLMIKDIDSAETEPLCPSLKILSLKNVHFNPKALLDLILGCPSVKYLSLTSCSFDPPVFQISSFSLRSLEVKNCNAQSLLVDRARDLESFTFVSNFLLLETIILKDTVNLKKIKMRAQHLKYFGLLGCHNNLNATVSTPNLHQFDIFAYLTSKVSINAPNLCLARITLREEEFSTFNREWKHSATFSDFLKAFGCSNNIILYISDFKSIIFPENFKGACYPPLRILRRLHLGMINPPTEETDVSDLEDSLLWMAPNAEERIYYPNSLQLLMANPPTEEMDIPYLEMSLLWMAPTPEERLYADLERMQYHMRL
ncbi:hypothetical protein ABKV19_000289 [Rosa sericea]